MGHVDHGKTSLLDAIRDTNVTRGEAGGITQHIGAYTITIQGEKIVFLDTPGHEAFTTMRARGAMVTDLAILVVAADDGVMPQTIEAINHAKAAEVPIIVAINKMDKPDANPDRVKQELAEHGIVPEEWGGDAIMVEVSALKHEGIDDLLEMILMVAEMQELKANPKRAGIGTVIEAQLDKGRGPVATIIVEKGSFHASDMVVTGSSSGRIRAMYDDKWKQIKKAGPSMPIQIQGLSDVPNAGDKIFVVEDERTARGYADLVKAQQREDMIQTGQKVSLDDLFERIQEGELQDLNIIVKTDVRGTIDAVRQSFEKLSNDEVRVNIIHGAVGGITQSDVQLATASNAIIIGFNVRPTQVALDMAKDEDVDIRTYRVIYEAIDDIEAAIKGMLAPTLEEEVIGRAEVRQTFRVPNAGTVAGIYVRSGKVTRNASIRLLRQDIVIFEGSISSLKRFKDDAREINTDRIRREIVVVHIALIFLFHDTVQRLYITGCPQCRYRKHLGLSAFKQARAMCSGQEAHFTGKRTDLVQGTIVDAHFVFQDKAAYFFFFNISKYVFNRFFFFGEGFGKMRERFCFHFFHLLDSFHFVGVLHGAFYAFQRKGAHCLIDLCWNTDYLDFHFFFSCLFPDGLDKGTELFNFFMGQKYGFKDFVFCELIRSRFHHHNGFCRAGNGQAQSGVFSLLLIRIQDVFVVYIGNRNSGNRTVKRNIG
jgi:translation initiation factor IF-2